MHENVPCCEGGPYCNWHVNLSRFIHENESTCGHEKGQPGGEKGRRAHKVGCKNDTRVVVKVHCQDFLESLSASRDHKPGAQMNSSQIQNEMLPGEARN